MNSTKFSKEFYGYEGDDANENKITHVLKKRNRFADARHVPNPNTNIKWYCY